jgi:nucleoside-diphosphate-sugar epimerase
MPRMRIALTGATGFVGRPVSRLLNERGHEVGVLARNPDRLEDAGTSRIVAGDFFNKMALAELVEGAGAVLHLGGAIKARGREGFFAINRDGTANLAAAAVKAGVKRFIFVSSLAAREPHISAYGASKQAAEQALAALGVEMRVLIVRPPVVYGPSDEATLPLLRELMRSVSMIPGKSDQRFSLIHVDDLAAVLCDAVESERTGLVEVDDLSGGYHWDDVFAITRHVFGTPKNNIFLPFGLTSLAGMAADAWAAVSGHAQMVSMGKMRELYHPDWVVTGENWPRPNPITLSQGLPETIRWYQERGKLPPGKAEDRSERHD